MSAGPPPSLLDRIEREIAQRPVPTREQHRARSVVVLLASVAPIIAVASMRGFDLGGRPLGYVVALGLSWGLVAFAATALVVRRPSALGRPRAVLLGIAVAVPAALASLSLAAERAWLAPAPSFIVTSAMTTLTAMCTVLALALSVLPLAALLYVYRRSDPVRPVALGAALGAVAASWSGAVLATLCPETATGHVLLAHVGPIALTAALAAAAGARVLRLRWIGDRTSGRSDQQRGARGSS